MALRLNGSTSGYIEIDAPAVASNQRFVLPTDFGFASGTVMLFQQTSSPTGWTKVTTHNDKALRVVSGTVTSGGVDTFSTVMNGSVGATTLSIAQIPSHNHQSPYMGNTTATGGVSNRDGGGSFCNLYNGYNGSLTTQVAGGSGSHTHSMNVAYVDVIFASKD